ncbi:MAG TPA: hypothetical protein VME70_14045 [Mycobacteriales bacterium]|nr:hypothetical protein [Mycobacteriales bacterium]
MSLLAAGIAVSLPFSDAGNAYVVHAGSRVAKSSGWTWSKGVKLPKRTATTAIVSLSCPSTHLCVASGTERIHGNTGDNGVWWTTDPSAKKPQWHYEQIPSQSSGGQTLKFISGPISCNDAGSNVDCAIASGGNIWQTSHPTKGWGAAPIDTNLLDGVACWVNVQCISSDDEGYILNTAGATVEGSAQPILPPAGVGLGTSLGCAPHRGGVNPFCVEVAGNSHVAYSTDPGGQTWHAGKVPGGGQIDSVSCATNTLCVFSEDASGGEAVVGVSRTPKAGESWIKTIKHFKVPEKIAGFAGSITAVDCNSKRLCIASGGGAKGNFVLLSTSPTASAGSWHSYFIKDGPAAYGGALGVACPSTKLCVVVGQNGDFVVGKHH